eukprot:SAG22_NODE_6295_length_873_cov_1.449612_1_plen_77_part_00
MLRLLGLDAACAGLDFYTMWTTKIFAVPISMVAVCVAFAIYEARTAAASKLSAIAHLRANIYFVIFLVSHLQTLQL